MPARLIGCDIQLPPSEEDRTLISTYQSLGYLKHGILILLQEATACCEGASMLFKVNNNRSLH